MQKADAVYYGVMHWNKSISFPFLKMLKKAGRSITKLELTIQQIYIRFEKADKLDLTVNSSSRLRRIGKPGQSLIYTPLKTTTIIWN